MKYIILDLGGGNHIPEDIDGLANEIISLRRMYDDKGIKIVPKCQLFQDIKGLKSLSLAKFSCLAYWLKKDGIDLAASVFCEETLKRALNFDLPFVKIACRKDLYYLIDKIPEHKEILCSIRDVTKPRPSERKGVVYLYCIPKYPALTVEYENAFGQNLSYSISDHTVNFRLYYKYRPIYYEKHYVFNRQKVTDPYGTDFCASYDDMVDLYNGV